jgi:hypothetical protein
VEILPSVHAAVKARTSFAQLPPPLIRFSWGNIFPPAATLTPSDRASPLQGNWILRLWSSLGSLLTAGNPLSTKRAIS